MKDLYQILGVAENADDAKIKNAYRKLAKELHPDATGGDKKKTERFKDVNAAYTVLGDKAKRAEYDRLKHAPIRPDGMPEGFDPETFSRTFGGGRPGQGGFDFSGGFGDINDLFASLFRDQRGGGGGRHGVRTARGSDMVGALEITLAEAALGTRRSIQTGSGRSVEVQIKPGVESGGRLRIPGRGAPAAGRGQPGDLFLDITVRPDPILRRSDSDIEMDLPLTVAEAILGAKVDVPTVDGPVSLKIPAGTSSGARIRLRGRGVKHPDGTRGDHYCRVLVMVPKVADDDAETRQLVEQLAKRTADKPVRTF